VFNAIFQQYVSYIMAVTYIGGENDGPATSHWQTLSFKVVSSTPFYRWESSS